MAGELSVTLRSDFDCFAKLYRRSNFIDTDANTVNLIHCQPNHWGHRIALPSRGRAGVGPPGEGIGDSQKHPRMLANGGGTFLMSQYLTLRKPIAEHGCRFHI
jgi:hypothetical protein